MIPVLVGDKSVGKEKCPLGCGSSWHGLPKPATANNTTCPSVWGIPVPLGEPVEVAPNVA